MKRTVLFLLLAALLTASPSFAVDKEVIQLQQSVALLQGMVREIQRGMDEKMAVLQTLVQQSGGNTGQISQQVGELKTLFQHSAAATEEQVESIHTQVNGLQSSLDDLRARLDKVSGQVAKIEENAQNAAASATMTTDGGVSVAPPAPDVLYNTALRDYTSGNYPLALQEFFEYLRYYANTPLASNAQFFIGDIYYQQGQFEKAIQEYDKAITLYPDGAKTAAAKLKKGFAMLNMNLKAQGITELKDLAAQFPNTPEAQLAKDKLATVEAPARRTTAR
ncbi:MAG: tetratricopeptide repeat protein [Acidobacteria bacterium]|nr:tetratricopeptide repeat protein [Acidobacteriota bacterium]